MNAQQKEDWFNPDATTFGDRLAGAREAAGMTQRDLSHRLGVKLKTLKGWEDDLNEPRANRLSIMAGLLNVSLSWLISGRGEGPDSPFEDSSSDDTLSDILRQMGELRGQIAAATDGLGRLEQTLRGLAVARAGEEAAEVVGE